MDTNIPKASRYGACGDSACPTCGNSLQNAIPADRHDLRRCASCKLVFEPLAEHPELAKRRLVQTEDAITALLRDGKLPEIDYVPLSTTDRASALRLLLNARNRFRRAIDATPAPPPNPQPGEPRD